MSFENSKEKNSKKLLKKERDEIYLRTMDECFRLPKPLTRDQIIQRCLKRINEKELEQNAVLSLKISKGTFDNYKDSLNSLCISRLGIPLPIKSEIDGEGEEFFSIKKRDGSIKSKNRPFATYFYTDKSFKLFDRVLDEKDRIKLKEIGAYLKNVSSRWQNDMLEDITQGMEILQLDLGNTEPKVQYELPYHLDDTQLVLFKKLYQAIEKKEVIEFEYDRHNIPGDEYFKDKSAEEVREFKLKVNFKVVMSPYFLKQSNNRWFLLGRSHDQYLEFVDYLMPISIDRLKTLKIQSTIVFQPNPGISLNDYYRNLVGITLERNQEKKNCWFITTELNIQKIQDLSKKGEATQKGKGLKMSPFDAIFKSGQIFKVSENQSEIKKNLKMALDFKDYIEKDHLFMEFSGIPRAEILEFLRKNQEKVKMLFPYTIEKDEFIFKNIRYLLIQLSNSLFSPASEIGFELISPKQEDFGLISAKEVLQRRFRKVDLDLLFSGQPGRNTNLLLVFKENLKVDTDLVRLLRNPEIKSKISIFSPDTLLRKVISSHEVKDVVLEVENSFAHYVVSKPFHNSQKIVDFSEIKEIIESAEIGYKWTQKKNEKSICFHLRLIPNKEFENLLLSKGEQVKVIHPISLKNKIAGRIEKMYQLYQKPKFKHS